MKINAVVAINAATSAAEYAIGWISLQSDGAVSVGLADRAFISTRFHARQFLWNAYNRVTVKYLVVDNPKDLRPVMNPHLTFHPPIYFHLRANNDEELFAGIAEVGIMLAQDELVPWIRFVSRPLREIPPARVPRNPKKTTVLRVPVGSPNVSLGLAVDFVQRSFRGLRSVSTAHFL